MTENQQNKTCEAALLNLRQDIDKIDDQLISLLMQRMKVVAKVGDLKKSYKEKFFIRSNREADMIRDLLEKSKNSLPEITVINIWRKIITTANMHEQPLHIAINNPKNISDYAYLVKDYYNNLVPYRNFNNAQETLSEVEKGESKIGIFDLSQLADNIKDSWWIYLAKNHKNLKIFAKIPFFELENDKNYQNKPQLVAIAAKKPEKSNDDRTIFYIETDEDTLKNEILPSFPSLKLLKSVNLSYFLLEIDGFYTENSDELKNFPNIQILGHYATPIKIG